MVHFYHLFSCPFSVFSQAAPVDKVLFLKGRATGRNMEVSTLVTSEGGYLRFWCLYGAKNEMGKQLLVQVSGILFLFLSFLLRYYLLYKRIVTA